ncbi:SSI family serine proteinase inhibitor [Nonomuraea sp. bgisy101]|uniref:SSI family serine proteinase inhibitor n=1 Tax=Nonomuraea sp. bgisy101 TaxID=3413784 RepID=UPI003D73F777
MRSITTLALAGAIVLAAASPALAGHRPLASLKVSVTVAGATKSAGLLCDRDGGDHPSPRTACRLLRAVKGDPARLRVKDPVCTREYRPHVVSVRGTWRGRPVSFTTTFANACLMKSAGGAVFTL